jgi:hypothetical protein
VCKKLIFCEKLVRWTSFHQNRRHYLSFLFDCSCLSCLSFPCFAVALPDSATKSTRERARGRSREIETDTYGGRDANDEGEANGEKNRIRISEPQLFASMSLLDDSFSTKTAPGQSKHPLEGIYLVFTAFLFPSLLEFLFPLLGKDKQVHIVAKIGDFNTDIVLTSFSDKIFIMVTQLGKIGTIVSFI